MPRIFLAELNPASWQGSFELGGNRMDPISIGYISSYLRSRGLETQVFQQRRESDEKVLRMIKGFCPDYVGLSVMTSCANHSLDMSRRIKKMFPKTKIILGGYHPTGVPKILGEDCVDFIVMGEGEETCFNLIDALENNTPLEEIGSLGFKKNEELRFTERAPRISSLDDLPFPDRYGLEECSQGNPMIPIPENQRAFAQIAWSRGCLHNCSFCNSPQMWGKQVYYRSAENVADELEYLRNRFGTNAIFFTDLTFNEDKERVIELCKEIRRRNIGINWSCSCRVTDDEEMLKYMRESGCVRIGFGIESLDDRVLAEIGKGITVEQIGKSIEAANDAGMITRGYYMIGYPHQSQDDIITFQDTITKIPLDQIRISFVTPFPGTAYFRSQERKGLIADYNWDHYEGGGHYVLGGRLNESALLRARQELFKTFYSDKRYQARILAKMIRFPELKPAYDGLIQEITKLV
ncbi:radical SAM protein [Candidatus Woesearchaeota archaeon]|nr:radical SAM protein [Candidatus Woesearchaeota archaeon]